MKERDTPRIPNRIGQAVAGPITCWSCAPAWRAVAYRLIVVTSIDDARARLRYLRLPAGYAVKEVLCSSCYIPPCRQTANAQWSVRHMTCPSNNTRQSEPDKGSLISIRRQTPQAVVRRRATHVMRTACCPIRFRNPIGR
jgi:hypothetical protein